MDGALRTIEFPGPAGPLEGLWKDAAPPRTGTAVLAHPHPLHGGTLHNKVVYRMARALGRAGYGTLRFNFRGVGRSAGRHDEGRGETDDYRAALGEAERRGGPPFLAGGFSFGAAVALRAIAGDPRPAAYVGVGLPLATASGRDLPPPEVPALLVSGTEDPFSPPDLLRRFAGGAARVVEVPGANHFLEGSLDGLESAIAAFLAELAREAPVR